MVADAWDLKEGNSTILIISLKGEMAENAGSCPREELTRSGDHKIQIAPRGILIGEKRISCLVNGKTILTQPIYDG